MCKTCEYTNLVAVFPHGRTSQQPTCRVIGLLAQWCRLLLTHRRRRRHWRSLILFYHLLRNIYRLDKLSQYFVKWDVTRFRLCRLTRDQDLEEGENWIEGSSCKVKIATSNIEAWKNEQSHRNTVVSCNFKMKSTHFLITSHSVT